MDLNLKIPPRAVPILIRIGFLFAGVLLGFILFRGFFVTFRIQDDSMEPNIGKGNLLLVRKHVTPAPGDAVLVESPVDPGRYLVKRVLAHEGDTVEIRDKSITLNGQAHEFTVKVLRSDPRVFPLSFSSRDTMPSVKLGRNEYFLIGDNLDYSFDSRAFGPVKGNLIAGKIAYKF